MIRLLLSLPLWACRYQRLLSMTRSWSARRWRCGVRGWDPMSWTRCWGVRRRPRPIMLCGGLSWAGWMKWMVWAGGRGVGRIGVRFGDDLHEAESVSCDVAPARVTMHSLLGFFTRGALNHVLSTKLENPDRRAASIAWIGYDTPSGWRLWRAAGRGL